MNGFGRIGRNFRAVQKAGADIEIVGVNDLTDDKTLAHLLKYDTVLGPLKADVTTTTSTCTWATRRSARSPSVSPANLPWAKPVLTSSSSPQGFFTDAGQGPPRRRCREGHHLHRQERGRHVRHRCEPHRLRPGRAQHHLERVLHDELPSRRSPRRRHGHRARSHDDESHAYTVTRTSRTARTATFAAPAPPPRTFVPTTTGAAKAVALVLPELKGKLDGYAPVITGSATDLTFRASREVTVEEVNNAAVKAGAPRGTLQYTEDPILLGHHLQLPPEHLRRRPHQGQRRPGQDRPQPPGTTTSGATPPPSWPFTEYVGERL
ncbi:glyceraldehyde 3-phosphate dehydrogenase NAD-binding domain-containing protein [Salana multivorans]